jgi:hypothetical protein
MTRHAVPLLLALPGGAYAAHVAGSWPARYVGYAGSVTLDATLLSAGWRWHGSTLCHPSGAAYDTAVYGVAGALTAARGGEQLRMFEEAA